MNIRFLSIDGRVSVFCGTTNRRSEVRQEQKNTFSSSSSSLFTKFSFIMSDLQADSSSTLERLISEQTSYIDEVDEQINKWKRFQTDYEHLQKRLKTLPDQLTYETMVPFGKLAFIPGRIVHSNEILVLLGENFFVERSAKQSLEIVQRRLTNIKENLDKHQKERQVFDQQKKYTNEFLDDRTKFVEIKEEEETIRPTKTNRREKLTEQEIREERRRLQERALKLVEQPTKKVRFEEKDEDSDDDDDDDEIPREQMKKISITHTPMETNPIGDPSPAAFSHPGTIGSTAPVAFTGKMIERTVEPPPKRISKFKASRT